MTHIATIYIFDLFFICAAKNLQCYDQLPEKLADGKEKAVGSQKKCKARTNYCWKIDTPAGIGKGCGGSINDDDDVDDDHDGVGVKLGVIKSSFSGAISDSCNTIVLGDSHRGCACHTNLCNTATITKASNQLKAGISLTLMYSFYTSVI